MPTPEEVVKQIDAAYDYRGHVTIFLKDGRTLEGFVYNRIKKTPKLSEGDYLDVMLKESEEKRRLKFGEVASIAFSGKDFAETFAQFQARTNPLK